jgi:hypothetical protein
MIETEEILRALTIILGILVLLSVLLMFSNLRKSKELIKAKLFLHYDKLNRLFVIAGGVIFIFVAFHLYYLLFLSPPGWFSLEPGGFVPYGIYTIAVYGGVTYFCITIWWILKEVK